MNALGTADPFGEHLGGLAGLVEPYRPEQLALKARHGYEVASNWKTIVEKLFPRLPVWDSLYADSTTRNLRHFTFRWSASNNVANGNCRSNCGDEGGGPPDNSTWYPIWWAARPKAAKWSGSTGPQNVVYNNALSKQTTQGFEAGLAVDGNTSTRWASREGPDPEWIQVDLGAAASLIRVRLTYGYSLWELELYGISSFGAVVDVSTGAQLQAALANATPGQTIRMAAGQYRGAFLTQKAGTASAPWWSGRRTGS